MIGRVKKLTCVVMAVAMIGSLAACKKSGKASSGLTDAANSVMEALISRSEKKLKKTGDFSEESLMTIDLMKDCDAVSAVMDKATFEIDEDSIKETKKGTSVKVVVTLPDSGAALEDASDEDEFIDSVSGQKEKEYTKVNLTLKFEVDEDKYTLTNGDDVFSDLFGGDLENVNKAFGKIKGLPTETEDDPPQTTPVEPDETPTPVPTDPPKASSDVYDVVVYQDDKTVIHFNKVDSDGVHFTVDNLAAYEATIQCNSLAIDGVAILDYTMSDKVAAGTSAEVVTKCELDEIPQKIGTVSGQLDIIDFDDYSNSYEASFDTTVIDSSVTPAAAATGTLIYTDDYVQIYFKELTSEGVVFEIVNLTAQDVEPRITAVAINGRNITDPTWYNCEIAPHSIATLVTKQEDSIDPSEAVGTISAMFEINNDMSNYETYFAMITTTVIDPNVTFTPPALEGTVFYEDANVKITCVGLSPEGPILGVENLTDVGIIVQAESLSINMVGIFDVFFSYYTAPHSVSRFLAEGPVDASAQVGVIGGAFIIANPADRKSNYMVHLDNVVVDASVTVAAPSATGTLLHEDSNVKIYFKEVREKGIVFDVENLTQYSLTIQDRGVLLNGVEPGIATLSDSCAPHSVTEVMISCSPDTSTPATTLSVNFAIFSWDNAIKHYEVELEDKAIG
ncbi:MAG: hypothetical protein IJL60_09335 [Clostridiales bacterium]|nr:hypothetical protein [Clostridiales bacterium]